MKYSKLILTCIIFSFLNALGVFINMMYDGSIHTSIIFALASVILYIQGKEFREMAMREVKDDLETARHEHILLLLKLNTIDDSEEE